MPAPRRCSAPAAFLMLTASLAAAAPIARWCPIRWGQVDAVAYLSCAAGFTPVATECPQRAAAAADDQESCGSMAACDAMESCPMRRAHLAAAAKSTECAARHQPAATDTHGRAYCLDDPAMASATRSQAPSAPAPIASAAVVAAIASLTPPARSIEHAPPAVDARPPTDPLEARPPVRGPPVLLG